MSLFSIFKRNSRLALRGSWGRAILVLLIPTAAAALLSLVQGMVLRLFVEPAGFSYALEDPVLLQFLSTSVVEIVILFVFSLLYMLLFAPLTVGIAHWYFELVHGRSAPLSDMFRFFESALRYGRALWLYVNLSLRSFFWALVIFLLPGGMLVICSITLAADSAPAVASIASLGSIVGAMLLILATLLYIALLSKYQLAAYLLSADDSLTVRQAIRQSVRYTRGYRFSLLWFQLSFLGWGLLGVFFFPLFYVLPYFNTAVAMYARYIIEKNRHEEAAQAPTEHSREYTQEFSAPEVGGLPPEAPAQEAMPAPQQSLAPEEAPSPPAEAPFDESGYIEYKPSPLPHPGHTEDTDAF